ncbi:TolB family protein [candidate division KSB1 bacterium]
MLRIIVCLSLTLLLFACGGEDESNVLKFAHANVYEIHLKDNAIDPTWSSDGATIVFSWENDLWSITPEGEEATRITTMSGQEIYPNFSPAAGSNQIVFVNNKGPEEFTINTLTLGGQPEVVETFSERITSTSFNSDGSLILFLQYGKKGIYSIPTTGGEATLIPNNQDWETVGVAQACPSRDVIIYSAQTGTDFSIRSIAIDGGDAAELLSFAGSGRYPTALAEAYDGVTLAAALQTDIWQRNIFTLASSGGETTALTEFPSDSFHPNNPSWSSDGARIVVQMPTGIYVVELK